MADSLGDGGTTQFVVSCSLIVKEELAVLWYWDTARVLREVYILQFVGWHRSCIPEKFYKRVTLRSEIWKGVSLRYTQSCLVEFRTKSGQIGQCRLRVMYLGTTMPFPFIVDALYWLPKLSLIALTWI